MDSGSTLVLAKGALETSPRVKPWKSLEGVASGRRHFSLVLTKDGCCLKTSGGSVKNCLLHLKFPFLAPISRDTVYNCAGLAYLLLLCYKSHD